MNRFSRRASSEDWVETEGLKALARDNKVPTNLSCPSCRRR